MSKKNAPLLSVGIIFKNEIRCLERCLRSLQPLKEKISCEIVMADTGSDDGSRAVAEKYADVLFDFPWINDFAAARNAVLDRSRGKWHLYIDCDEWLDEDVSELVGFLKGKQAHDTARAIVRVRDYSTWDFDKYSDFQTARLVNMSWNPRFHGAIHETPKLTEKPGRQIKVLTKTILHHDGYIGVKTTEQGRAKIRRNIEILREEMRKYPDELRILRYFLQAGDYEPDFMQVASQATGLVMDRAKGWDVYGPQIYRYAIHAAWQKKLPQLSEWAQQAKELFSERYGYRLDIQYMLCCNACEQKDYSVCIELGEDYEQALRNSENDEDATVDCANGNVYFSGPAYVQDVNAALALAYAETGRTEDAAARIERTDWTLLNKWETARLLLALRRLHLSGRADTKPLILAFWEGIGREEPTAERARDRRRIFLELGANNSFWETEGGAALFAPLKGQCVLGDAAEMLETEDAARLGELIVRQDKTAALPVRALIHALEHGAPFPPPNRSLTPETAAALAAKLFSRPEKAKALAKKSAEGDFSASWPTLLWARALTARAVQSVPKNEDIPEDEAADAFSAMRAFARIEKVFLPRYYTPEAIDAPDVLPAADRLGRDLVRVFEALGAERYSDCVRLLREGLEREPERKPLVEIMLGEVQRREKLRRAAEATPEMLEMAEKVRAILSSFPPDDPAVAEIKQSPTYQALAYLIEGPEKKF